MTQYIVKGGQRRYYRELLAQLPPGFQIGLLFAAGEPGNQPGHSISRKHAGVLLPDGTILRSPTGVPVRVATTPGSRSSRHKDLRNIRRALEQQ